jgi:hypothetical protein
VFKNIPVRLLGPGSKQEFALVILVPRSLPWTLYIIVIWKSTKSDTLYIVYHCNIKVRFPYVMWCESRPETSELGLVFFSASLTQSVSLDLVTLCAFTSPRAKLGLFLDLNYRSLSLQGPWGRSSKQEIAWVNLEPQGYYFEMPCILALPTYDCTEQEVGGSTISAPKNRFWVSLKVGKNTLTSLKMDYCHILVRFQ